MQNPRRAAMNISYAES